MPSDLDFKTSPYDVLTSKSFPNICRLCLLYGDLYLIANVDWEGIQLKDLIYGNTLKLTEEDKLPQKMCKSCIKTVYNVHQFFNKCNRSEHVLQLILQRESNEIKTETIQKSLEIRDSNDKDNVTKIEEEPSQTDEKTEIDDSKNDVRDETKERRLRSVTKSINSVRLAQKNKPKPKKGPPYICITCNESFDSTDELKQHKIDMKHKKSLKFKCNHCEKKYDTYCKYEEHVRTHTGEKPNKCNICGKCFNFKTDLKRHMVMHSEIKPYSCKFCTKGFARKAYLVDHERKHTGEKVICPFCGKGFHSSAALFYHEKIHKGKTDGNSLKVHQCHVCSKQLLTEQTLKAHVLLHGPRNFSCDICGKTAISKTRLADHMKQTHREKKWACHLCNKEYKQKCGLEIHLKAHSGENFYPCETCGKHFTCKGTLYQHKRIHTAQFTMGILHNIYYGYRDLMDNKSDQRVKDWFLMSSPLPTLCICLTYVLIVKVIGPKLMENRKPFELKKILIYYNLFQVIFSTWLFYEASAAGWLNHYSFKCQPVDYSRSPLAMRMVHGCWWYYFSKFTEFFDTFFFVLRKKFDHVSTLHVIHHGIMPMSVWFGVKFTPGGHSTFFGFLNTFVHIIMYSYYLIAALGPQYQKYLWWKKYLTAIQMVQFVLVMVHAFQLLFIDCNYPKAFVWWIGMHAVMFYLLFSKFYKQTYNKRTGKLKTDQDNGATGNNNNVSKKSKVGICFTSQQALYEDTDTKHQMTNGYTTSDSSKLRNRVYIDRDINGDLVK